MTLKRFIKKIVISLPLVFVVILGGLYYYNLLTMPILIKTDEFNKEEAILLSNFIKSNLDDVVIYDKLHEYNKKRFSKTLTSKRQLLYFLTRNPKFFQTYTGECYIKGVTKKTRIPIELKFEITDRSGMLTLVDVDIKGMHLADNQIAVIFEKFVQITKQKNSLNNVP
jgi:hypothetical protein